MSNVFHRFTHLHPHPGFLRARMVSILFILLSLAPDLVPGAWEALNKHEWMVINNLSVTKETEKEFKSLEWQTEIQGENLRAENTKITQKRELL